jgi:hypothetical protein
MRGPALQNSIKTAIPAHLWPFKANENGAALIFTFPLQTTLHLNKLSLREYWYSQERLGLNGVVNLSMLLAREAVLGVAMQRIAREIAKVLSQKAAVRLKYRALAVGVCALLSTGCATLGTRSSARDGWLENGSLTLSRPVPSDTSAPRARLSDKAAESLMSTEVAHVVVSRSSQTITALQPGSAPQVFKAEGAQHLSQGTFSITVREEKPLWYAPNEYFTKRSLPVPKQGSRSRFMRAALGQRALYLNDQTPIHAGPVWLHEIGGLRIRHSDMEQLYSMVTVGTRVEVR